MRDCSRRCWSRRLLLANSVIASVVACTPDTPASAPQQFADLQLAQEVRIDGDSAELTVVGGVRVGPDGALVVSQPATHELLVFDEQGRFVRRIGGTGDGPGEFRALGGFGFVGDTLWVDDRIARRTTMLTIRGEVIQTVPYAGRDAIAAAAAAALPEALRLAASDFTAPATSAISQRGLSIGMPSVAPLMLMRRGVSERPLFSMTRDGLPVRTLALLPLAWIRYTSRSDSIAGERFINLPLALGPLWLASGGGERVVIINPEYESARLHVLHLAPNGDTLASHRVAFEPIALPRDFADSAARQMAARARRPDDAGAIRAALRLPASFPPVLWGLADDSGATWLGLRPDGYRAPWMIVTAEGRVAGLVQLSVMERALLVRGNRLWVAAQDSLGVESVIRYAVRGLGR